MGATYRSELFVAITHRRTRWTFTQKQERLLGTCTDTFCTVEQTERLSPARWIFLATIGPPLPNVVRHQPVSAALIFLGRRTRSTLHRQRGGTGVSVSYIRQAALIIQRPGA